ncbi:acyl-CoA carboxylase subunit epsilon [Kineosporia mesophila]|uniref:Acyl-CoA carboxylase subunit epsilon n=1 Tax=Kineosporia mesophila TaxID=566012 RepID=A0ABP6ZS28_9ACTN|nr:acyl-CoA carboxylase subunit epsilon [Kineosporia mesophila]MCD5349828.1 acyl-CoA carboxylase subunit epsilon [Kineosporia mesophila]
MLEDESTERPLLRLVRGDATEEEVAALLAVIRTVGSSDGSLGQEAGPTSSWTDRASLTRQQLSPGPGAWRASGRAR